MQLQAQIFLLWSARQDYTPNTVIKTLWVAVYSTQPLLYYGAI